MHNVHDSLNSAFDVLVEAFADASVSLSSDLVFGVDTCVEALDRARSSLSILQHAAHFSSEERYDALKIDLAGFRGSLSRLESSILKSGVDMPGLFGKVTKAYSTVWAELLDLDSRRQSIRFVPLARATQSAQPQF